MTVVELVDALLRLMNKEGLRPTILNEASNEIPQQFLDCTKAKTMLDWKPTFSPDDALRETIDWYRQWLAQ